MACFHFDPAMAGFHLGAAGGAGDFGQSSVVGVEGWDRFAAVHFEVYFRCLAVCFVEFAEDGFGDSVELGLVGWVLGFGFELFSTSSADEEQGGSENQDTENYDCDYDSGNSAGRYLFGCSRARGWVVITYGYVGRSVVYRDYRNQFLFGIFLKYCLGNGEIRALIINDKISKKISVCPRSNFSLARLTTLGGMFGLG